jgi:amidase
MSVPISRRTFTQLVGAAAVTGAGAAPVPQGDRRDELCDQTAVQLAALVRARRVSARELLSAHLARIERVNPKLNAIVTLAAERAQADAAKADEAQARGDALGPLHGLPIAHKDLVDTAGIRTTRGSRFYREHVPAKDGLLVSRIKAAGAVTLGKTNTPEFGAGSQTFNEIFGATRNPYDLAKTVGGSSGGAAAALRAGMVPIADGSDMGGSLRNPAAFCNVVGFRPSPGRVARDDSNWSPLAVAGPMGRTVADVALLLSAIAGPNPGDPLSIDEDGARFRAPLEKSFKGVRVAWWKGLGGIPFEPEIGSVVNANRRIFEQLGCIVEEAEPDFTGVDQAFLTLRHLSYHERYKQLVTERAEWVKDTVQWEVAQAERRTATDVAKALARQAALYAQTRAFFARYDYFVLPVTQVAPFDVTTPYPRQVAGTPMVTYIDWMRSCWYVTFMATPAISVPGGFTAAGLPVGVQIVGRHRNDWSVLQLAHAFERATGHGARKPVLVSQ